MILGIEDTDALSSLLSFGIGNMAEGLLCSGGRGLIGNVGVSIIDTDKVYICLY